MREIAPEAWPRSEHFKTFGAFHYPHFNMCAEVDLTVFRAAVTQEGASLTTAIVYVIARAANDIPEFRQRIRGETVVEHDVVHPSTTILVDEDLFSFCALDYTEDFSAFTAHAAERVADVKKHPTLATRPERDDLLYMTAIPWVSFTSFAHPILSLPADSVPRFAWGKFHNDGDRVKECGTSPFVSQLADEAFWDGSETGPLLVTNRACPPPTVGLVRVGSDLPHLPTIRKGTSQWISSSIRTESLRWSPWSGPSGLRSLRLGASRGFDRGGR